MVAHAGDARAPLRIKCNYFIEHPPKNPIHPQAIVNALNETLEMEAAGDSYIKWQLLSAAPARFEPDSAHQAAIAYLNAAKPTARPGAQRGGQEGAQPARPRRHERRRGDGADQKARRPDRPMAEAKRAGAELPRRALRALPPNGEALVARLLDDAQRVEAGYDVDAEMKATTDAIESWIDTKPPAAHLQIVADQVKEWMNRGKPPATPAVQRGGQTARRSVGRGYNVKHGKADDGEPMWFPPTFYDHVEFVAVPTTVVRGGGKDPVPPDFKWQWSSSTARQFDPQVLSDLVVTLEEFAKVAAAAEMAQQ